MAKKTTKEQRIDIVKDSKVVGTMVEIKDKSDPTKEEFIVALDDEGEVIGLEHSREGEVTSGRRKMQGFDTFEAFAKYLDGKRLNPALAYKLEFMAQQIKSEAAR